jgi:hypothetical protein
VDFGAEANLRSAANFLVSSADNLRKSDRQHKPAALADAESDGIPDDRRAVLLPLIPSTDAGGRSSAARRDRKAGQELRVRYAPWSDMFHSLAMSIAFNARQPFGRYQ